MPQVTPQLKGKDPCCAVTFVNTSDFSSPASDYGDAKDCTIVEGALQSSKLKKV
jgi:hypothetical protein